MKIITEIVKESMEEYKNLVALEASKEFLRGYLHGLLSVLDWERSEEAQNLKDTIFGLKESL